MDNTLDDHTVGVAPTAEEVEDSKALACGVCLDVVRPRRLFGIQSGCEHTICLTCVRTWRASHSVSPEVARSCPECRTLSHHVIPSTFIPANAERKAALAHGYLRRLRTLPCKHFDFGAGTCPFGSSCFYAHVDKQGCPVVTAPRRVLVENGSGRGHVLPTYRLSDYLFATDASQGANLLDSLPIQDLRLEGRGDGED
jgi:E3 ubiquitin-protein ligase makorin